MILHKSKLDEPGRFCGLSHDTVMKIPVIDLSECEDCEACLDLCPAVFRRHDAGYIEVVDLPEYPEEKIEEIIKNCPVQCVTWEEA